MDMVRFGRYLEIIEAEGLVENARETGGHLLRELSRVGSDHPEQVENVRGRGLMCAFDLADGETRDRFRKLAFENGMLVLGCGSRSIPFPAVFERQDGGDRPGDRDCSPDPVEVGLTIGAAVSYNKSYKAFDSKNLDERHAMDL